MLLTSFVFSVPGAAQAQVQAAPFQAVTELTVVPISSETARVTWKRPLSPPPGGLTGYRVTSTSGHIYSPDPNADSTLVDPNAESTDLRYVHARPTVTVTPIGATGMGVPASIEPTGGAAELTAVTFSPTTLPAAVDQLTATATVREVGTGQPVPGRFNLQFSDDDAPDVWASVRGRMETPGSISKTLYSFDSGWYRLQYIGDNGWWPTAPSERTWIRVTPRLTLTAAAQTPPGTAITLNGTVYPHRIGTEIAAETLVDGTWVRVGTATTGDTPLIGAVTIMVPSAAPGTHRYRLTLADSARYGAAVSPTVDVAVR